MSLWRRRRRATPTARLRGFVVRPAALGEAQVALHGLLSTDFLSLGPAACWGAYGQPGDVLMGAASVLPQGDDRVAGMQVWVKPEYRRHGVGLGLVTEVYEAALRCGATELYVYGHVHQDDPGVPFAERCGMTAMRRRVTYNADIAKGVPTGERIVKRYGDHPHLRGGVIEPALQIDPPGLASFMTSHYPCGSQPFQLDRIRAGYYDMHLSVVARDGERVVAAMMNLSRPETNSLFVELILCEPSRRSGPLPTALLLAMARQALPAGVPRAVYEADAEHESFAVSFAKRCGAASQHMRYRYAIDRAGIERFMASGAAVTIA